MGLGNMPVGFAGAVTLVTIPQMLAAKGIPESAIAWFTTASLVAGFANFLIAPVLDWRLSRRSYAIIMAALAGLRTIRWRRPRRPRVFPAPPRTRSRYRVFLLLRRIHPVYSTGRNELRSDNPGIEPST
jgi:hypothetical protein